MAMLAERKRKQKWCINPRGQDWSEDSNKFGQKLLEKMGWSKGKGLGAKEDGITEHVKVSFKHDQKGMGFKEDQDPWTENEVGFANLLKDLSSQNQYTPQLGSDGGSDNSESTDVLNNIQSLESKSKSSRARVHYRKFTRGKDLSRYTAKDIAQIFGKPSMNSGPSSTLTASTSVSTMQGSKSNEDEVSSTTNFGEASEDTHTNSANFTNSQTDIVGYFQKKMFWKHSKRAHTVTSSDVNENLSREIETTVEELRDIITTSSEKPAKTSKKKKRKSFTIKDADESQPDSSQERVIKLIRTPNTINLIQDYTSKNLDSSPSETNAQLEQGGYSGENDCKQNTDDLQQHNHYMKLDKVDYYVEPKKDRKRKKKYRDEDSLKIKLKKKHTYDNPGLNPNDTKNDAENNNINEVERKIKKKKKKRGIENPALELSNSDEASTPKKKKRKTTFISYMNSDTENTLTVKSVPKKRKRSQNENDNFGYDNPAFSENSTKRKRSRNNNEDCAYDNPAFTENSIKSTRSRNTGEISGCDNPAFSENTKPESEEVATPEPKNVIEGIDNPALDDSDALSPTPPDIEPEESGVNNILPNTPKSALKKKSTTTRPRKSVQINESINQEKFITDDSSETSQGDEEDTSISDRIENYQIELENSLNEKKCVVNGKDNTSKKFKNIALKKLTQRRISVEFPGVKHETIIKGYGNLN